MGYRGISIKNESKKWMGPNTLWIHKIRILVQKCFTCSSFLQDNFVVVLIASCRKRFSITCIDTNRSNWAQSWWQLIKMCEALEELRAFPFPCHSRIIATERCTTHKVTKHTEKVCAINCVEINSLGIVRANWSWIYIHFCFVGMVQL